MGIRAVTMESKTTVHDPEYQDTKKADGSGRLYLGSEYADKEVKFIVVSSHKPTDESN